MKEKEFFKMSNDKMYLLIKIIRESAKHQQDQSICHNLKEKAEVLNQLMCWDFNRILDYYKKFKEVKENGNN